MGTKGCLAPIAARTYLVTEQNLASYYDRQAVIDQMIAYIQENESEAELCMQYFQQFITSTQEKITIWAQNTLSDLQTAQNNLRTQVSAMTQMLSDLRYKLSFDLNTELEQLVSVTTTQQQVEQAKDRFRLFAFQFKPYLLTSVLGEMFSFEEDYSVLRPTKRVAFFAGDDRKCVDYCLMDQVKREREMSNFDPKNGSAWCLLPSLNQFLYTGGLLNSHVSSDTFLLNSLSKASVRKESMLQARFSHAIACSEGAVVVFGGCRVAPQTQNRKATTGKRTVMEEGEPRGVLMHCESYDFDTDRWTRIADMIEPRYGASASALSASIYIVGGMGSKHGEVYHPSSNTFHLLPFELPQADKFTTVLCVSEMLIICHDRSLYQFHSDKPETGLERLRELPEEGNWYSPLQPILHEGSYYFARSAYEMWRLKTDSTDLRLAFSLF